MQKQTSSNTKFFFLSIFFPMTKFLRQCKSSEQMKLVWQYFAACIYHTTTMLFIWLFDPNYVRCYLRRAHHDHWPMSYGDTLRNEYGQQRRQES